MADERVIPDHEQDEDEVIEAGLESFPASDPPSFTMPARHRFVRREPAADSIEGPQGHPAPPPTSPANAASTIRRAARHSPERLILGLAGVAAAVLLLALARRR